MTSPAVPAVPAAPPPLDHAAVRPVIAGLMLAMFLSALEQTIVAPALAAIGRSLNDIENLSWVVTSYLLASTVATPLFGKLSDIYGRRAMMLIAVAIFVVGSVACALAPSMGALIAARALQGFGGGGILPLAQTVIADILTPRERPIFQGYSSVMFMAASILGPLLGGVLTDYLHWSFIFWIMLPLGAVALVMTERALRRIPRNDRPHKLDVIGAAAMLAAAVLLLLALSWGGVRYSWGSPQIAALLVGSLTMWLAFAWRLARAPEPFIPLSMIGEPLIGLMVVAGFFSIGTIIGLAIVVPLYLELVLGYSASAAGIALIAYVVGNSIGSLSAGRLMSRLVHYKRVPLWSMPLSIATFLAAGVGAGRLVAARHLPGAGDQRLRRRHHVSVHHGDDPERGRAASLRDRDRHAQLLPPARRVDHRGGVRGDRVRRAGGRRRRAHAGDAGPGAGRGGSGAGERAAHFAPLFSVVFLAAALFLAVAMAAVLPVEERPLRGRG